MISSKGVPPSDLVDEALRPLEEPDAATPQPNGQCMPIGAGTSGPQSDEEHSPNGATHIALVDQYAFTRECISRSLGAVGSNLHILPYPSLAAMFEKNSNPDLLLYHLHEADSDTLGNFDWLQMRRAIAVAPTLVLSGINQQETMMMMLRNGIRAYIPTENTSIQLLAEIINLVRAGGTFAPLSSLGLNEATLDESPVTAPLMTPREQAVLTLLKRGRANKLIAHELSMSQSTVKVHVRSIMRKLKVTNRTEAVSRAYKME